MATKSPLAAGGHVGPPTERRIDERLTQRVIVERVRPSIDGGRFPIKRTPGESVQVTADIFADGHDVLAAVLCDRAQGSSDAWREIPMTLAAPGTDAWTATFDVSAVGWHE